MSFKAPLGSEEYLFFSMLAVKEFQESCCKKVGSKLTQAETIVCVFVRFLTLTVPQIPDVKRRKYLSKKVALERLKDHQYLRSDRPHIIICLLKSGEASAWLGRPGVDQTHKQRQQ